MTTYDIHIDKREGPYDGTDLKADLDAEDANRVRTVLEALQEAGSIYDFSIGPVDANPGFTTTIREINRIGALK